MRTANFRDDVLWAIAYKLGLNPSQEFLVDEGEALASYINAWVRKTWDTADFPEWTSIQEFTPNANHQVAWQAVPVGAPGPPVVLSRPLKVYLVDPRTAPYPIDTRFREWDEGLHVGFDHGATVWIKYMGLPPKFTSIPWQSSTRYAKGDLTYSPVTGQCYQSPINDNIGNDPAALLDPTNLSAEVLVPFAPGTLAVPVTLPEKWSVEVDPFNMYALANALYSVAFVDAGGAAHAFSYTTPGAGGTVDNVLNGLLAAAAASGDTWITALALSKDTPNALLIAQLATATFAVSDASVTVPVDVVTTGGTPPDEPVTGDDSMVVTP